ncbi:hypothetical protein IJ732_01610 [bacterium]|nr:hypothetical protein [bacterium]
MRIQCVQDFIDKVRGKKDDFKIFVNEDYQNIKYKNIITTRGFFYSGSSTITGFLEEFDNTFVYGAIDNIYSVVEKSLFKCGNEVYFFHYSVFFDYIDAFKNKNLSVLEKDVIIKNFVRNIYSAYDRKMLSDWDYCPNFYNSSFFEISMNYLFETLLFNEYDLKILKTQRIPFMFEQKNNTVYENCSFMYGKGFRQHPVLKFKDITEEEFDKFTSKYLHYLFNVVNGKEVLVYDQLVAISDLDKINYYMNDIPIKQICVWRDPRDHFFSLFKNDDKGIIPRKADDFIQWYRKKLVKEVFEPHPNRLTLRFEDIVFNYDESTQKVMDFAGLKPENHVAPKSVFNPEISKVNVGAWKDFYDQDFMKKVGDELKEYCYIE